MDAVKSWPRPLSPSDIRSFLRLIGYYRSFVEGFSLFSSLLMALTQKKVKFILPEACEKSFQELKDRLASTPELTLPERTNGFVVHCVASRNGLGCILMQIRKVNAYVSNALSRLSMGSVAHIDDDKKEFDQDVHILARLDVRLVDSTKCGFMVHTGSKSSFVENVKPKQGLDPTLVELKEVVLKKFLEAFSQGRHSVLRYQGRLCIPNVDDFRGKILSEAYSSRYSIHLGATKMYHDLREIYWWNEMKMDISEFVAPNYQQGKVEHQKLERLSQNISIPTLKWEDLNMDFIVGLPRQWRKHDSIWVIVDRMMKLGHFIPVKVSYSV
ncbi:hypothetical protein MTR67_001738 [Solanum verrucosum]|uniref:Integrase zinc-binding domain-containing protein n=1 Tax=Solanum verrucosum TaxID=315347 RepID=A0AAF0PNQ3_SOLVR|nr:hypothetical protein MTR67_001738 [Solanum verrucosum]